jgi:hypothetical protein
VFSIHVQTISEVKNPQEKAGLGKVCGSKEAIRSLPAYADIGMHYRLLRSDLLLASRNSGFLLDFGPIAQNWPFLEICCP